jgi:ATP-dependent DNA helicase PIF1
MNINILDKILNIDLNEDNDDDDEDDDDDHGLNTEQLKAFNEIKNGNNVFLCGQAGTGKSYCLTEVKKWAKQNQIYYGITATTGSSGILIGGTTIHSFLGIGIGNKSAKDLANYVIQKKPFVYNRLKRLNLLIIDEISMMDSHLFDTISTFLGIIRGNNKPFGGIQFVICGDLYQLPPIQNKHCFKSTVWPNLNITTIELTESQRHKEDLEFVKILSELKKGICSDSTLEILKATKDNIFPSDITPTILYTKNIDVDSLNKEKYDELILKGSRSFEYKLKLSSESAKGWSQSCKIPESVQICEGAQVVLTWNIDLDAGLCNGSRGVVTNVGLNGVTVKFMSGLTTLITYNKVENEDNKKTWISFMPLRLAYAITVNKSQGMTLDCAIIHFDQYVNENNSFIYGRAYTALSRVRNINCVKLINVSAALFKAHPDVIEFINSQVN